MSEGNVEIDSVKSTDAMASTALTESHMRPRKIDGVRRFIRPRNFLKRSGVAVCLVAASLAVSASPAAAAVTIGQIGPPPMGSGACGNELDLIQPTVSSGNPYVVPNTGGVTSWTVTSWTTLGGGPLERRALKVFRKIAEPATYEVVAHDGPQALTPGGTAGNTFSTALPVRAGDVLGLHMTTTGQCAIDVTDSFLLATTDLGDGQSFDNFSLATGRLQVEAVVTPTSDFSRRGLKRNKRKGTATLTFDVPNPGELTGSGKGVKVAGAAVTSKTVTEPGKVKLTIRAKGKKKATLNETGKVKVKPKITYTPTGGDPRTQSVKVKLKKKL